MGLTAPSELATEDRKTINWGAYYELTKPRLSFLSVVTALVGYFAALPQSNLWTLFHFICGTALCAGGAAALNQWWERDTDAIMPRTKDRLLPAGQIQPPAALLFGLCLSVVGCAQLYFGATPLAGYLGIATIVSYVALYTPLKRFTRWATEVGAIPGALPPLIGWAAAQGEISALGWILFGILTFWQIPHFMAIAWTFRADYKLAGFPMLTVIDPSGNKAGAWSIANAVALFAVSLLPVYLGLCGYFYGVVATVFGIWITIRSIRFAQRKDRDLYAKKLFFNSIFYLPAVLFSLVIDRWIFA